MDKGKIAKAKEEILSMFSKLSGESKIEMEKAMTKDGKELSYDTLEVGSEVKIGEDIVEDGEYEMEDGSKIVILDGKISEIIEAPEETDPVNMENDPIDPVDPIDTVSPIEDPEAKPTLSEILNVEELSKLIDIEKMQNGWCSISFEVEGGQLKWGDVYTSDYKTLMSSNKSQNKEIDDLKLELTKQKAMVVALSAAGTESTIVDAPVTAMDDKPMTQKEALRARLG